MADNRTPVIRRTLAIRRTEGRVEIPMAGRLAWLKTPAAVPALRLAAAR